MLGILTGCLGGSIAVAANETASFDYLYIESNEGGSSGGHTAIRFGPDIYHFQNMDGLLVLLRERANDFLYAYALLGNRTVHSTRIGVSTQSLSRLVGRFRARHRAQEAQILVGDALTRDRKLLESLRNPAANRMSQTEYPSLSIPGLGYFDLNRPVAGIRSVALLSLGRDIVRAQNHDFLANRRQQLIEDIARLTQQDPTHWATGSPTSVYDHPPFSRPYASRLIGLAAGLAALDVLEAARPLAESSYHAPLGDTFRLDPEAIRVFERYAEILASQLVDLVASERPDWGRALLVGMARLSAAHQTLDTRRLVFLDTFPEGREELDRISVDPSGEVGAMILLENRTQFEAARAYFRQASSPDELAWQRLEERSNRYLEILRALQGKGLIRVARGHLVPGRAALYSFARSPGRTATQLAADVAHARERESSYERAIRRLHRYGLVDRNCATAIFQTLNQSFDASAEVSEQKLGGYIGRRHSLTFIPFISAQQVNARYRVIGRETFFSYRQRRLHRMRSREGRLRVAFRESNPFTAKTYQPNANDSFFVFFTDETTLLRPVFGSLNLTAALIESVFGVLAAPFDHGEILLRGLRGAFVSLPELAFATIRKGSNDWIPLEDRHLDPVAAGNPDPSPFASPSRPDTVSR